MKCYCCDHILNDAEATAKFTDSGSFVNMCTKCRGFLPSDLKITLRPDLEKKGNSDRDDYDYDEEDNDELW